MGISSAPGLASMIFVCLKHVLIATFSDGTTVSTFIDDFLLGGDSVKELTRDVQIALEMFRKYDISVSIDKCILNPVRQIEYLGYWLTQHTLSMP
jgi:hypothetical protein